MLVFQEFLQAQSIPTPQSHFGFELGTDGKLASWKSIIGYYRKLDSSSDRILVKELGQSTLGNPFILIWDFPFTQLKSMFFSVRYR